MTSFGLKNVSQQPNSISIHSIHSAVISTAFYTVDKWVLANIWRSTRLKKKSFLKTLYGIPYTDMFSQLQLNSINQIFFLCIQQPQNYFIIEHQLITLIRNTMVYSLVFFKVNDNLITPGFLSNVLKFTFQRPVSRSSFITMSCYFLF